METANRLVIGVREALVASECLYEVTRLDFGKLKFWPKMLKV